MTNDETTLATTGTTTNQEITNDLTVSMGADPVPNNNVSTSVPTPVGMDFVPIAAGAVVRGLVVILMIVTIIVSIAAFVFNHRRQGRQGEVYHKVHACSLCLVGTIQFHIMLYVITLRY